MDLFGLNPLNIGNLPIVLNMGFVYILLLEEINSGDNNGNR